MSTNIVDLDHMMETLAQASKDPNGVTVGDFAKAVQSLQAELKMLESEVDRLGGAVDAAFASNTDQGEAAGKIDTATPTEADVADETMVQSNA